MHISPVCLSKTKRHHPSSRMTTPTEQSNRERNKQRSTHHVQKVAKHATSDKEAAAARSTDCARWLTVHESKAIEVLVSVNGKKLMMELDTGAAVSIISD